MLRLPLGKEGHSLEPDGITRALSIWGAVTGTIGTVTGAIGLWLRFRQHRLDKALLRSEAIFAFEGASEMDAKRRIVVRSIGRRGVTLDAVHYYITPRTRWQKIFKTWHHKKGRWIFVYPLDTPINLSEGEKAEIKVSMPNGLNIPEIHKVAVVDQSGRHWPVKWPSASRLVQIATSEKLDFFEEKTERRVCKAAGYRLGEKYYLETLFNTIPGRTRQTCARHFWLHNLEAYRSKFADVKENQCPKFLAGEIEEIT